MMGPYCRFCDHRCFVPMPAETPAEALKAYGSSTIVATCPRGQEFEMERVGWCYDRIGHVINERRACSLEDCPITYPPHYHRDTPDGEEVVEITSRA